MADKATDRGAVDELTSQSRKAAENLPAAKGGRLRVFASLIYRDDRKLQWALLAFMVLCYGTLLLIGWGHSARTTSLRLTFNTMLAHLMHGQFDVDPQIVGDEEGFLRNGRIYPYFGIFPALLRLPLWIIGRMDIDLTLWSVLAAVCIAGMAKVRAVLLFRKHAMQNSIAASAVGLMLIYVLLGGCGIGELNASVYEEVILWAGAFAAVFVYLVLKGIVNRCFDVRILCWMALCAGLALNTRVTGGIGLILALVLLLLAVAASPVTALSAAVNEGRQAAVRRFYRALTQHRVLLPAGVLTAFIAMSGTVNYFRWGNPATFANWDLYLGAINGWPQFLERMDKYGAFNLTRIPFNFSYYFFPFWAVHASNGDQLLESTWARTMISVELPPSSFFLTDTLAFCFIALLIFALWKRRSRGLPPVGRWAAAAAIGLLAPCILMLMAPHATYRYRVEFYPEIEFLAFVGLYLTVTNEKMLALFARFRNWIAGAVAVSIASSLLGLALLDVGQPLPPEPDPQGLVHYYLQITADHYHKILARHSSPQE
jgi:hypothetical protein